MFIVVKCDYCMNLVIYIRDLEFYCCYTNKFNVCRLILLLTLINAFSIFISNGDVMYLW